MLVLDQLIEMMLKLAHLIENNSQKINHVHKIKQNKENSGNQINHYKHGKPFSYEQIMLYVKSYEIPQKGYSWCLTFQNSYIVQFWG